MGLETFLIPNQIIDGGVVGSGECHRYASIYGALGSVDADAGLLVGCTQCGELFGNHGVAALQGSVVATYAVIHQLVALLVDEEVALEVGDEALGHEGA